MPNDEAVAGQHQQRSAHAQLSVDVTDESKNDLNIAVPGGFVADVIVSQCATDLRQIEISALTIEA